MQSFFTPGRVNIIGEHIDYCGGYVLPCTLEMGTTATLQPRNDGKARFTSENFPDLAVEIGLDNVQFDPAHDWANYPKGIVRLMQDDGHHIPGFNLHFSGNIPNGAGLSSSASIEVVTATALNTWFNLKYDKQALVLLAQRAENNFCGVNCGIMDQFAVGMGKPNHAIYLNCGTLEHKHVPMNLHEYKLIVMNTNKRRALNESKYNERRAECEEALRLLNADATPPWQHLADLTPDDLQRRASRLPETLHKRARHVIHENHRVKQAVEALEAGDVPTLGALLNASHASLRNDYEVTGKELDAIVLAAQKHPACAGARMTGAGFGGCAIALVKAGEVEAFTEAVGVEYQQVVGYEAAFYN